MFAGEITLLIVKCPQYRQSDMWIARQMVVNISGAVLNSGSYIYICVYIYEYRSVLDISFSYTGEYNMYAVITNRN